jgi:hypothetical protein
MEPIKGHMTTEKIIKPNQPGTKKWVEKYGENLICVRYRYDKTNCRMLKTVEIVVEAKAYKKTTYRIPSNKLIPLKVEINDANLRRIVKNAGGKWHQKEKVWMLPYKEIIKLRLENKIEQNLTIKK